MLLADQQKSPSTTAVHSHEVAAPATSKSTAVQCGSALVSDSRGNCVVRDAPKCTIAVAAGSSADGQTDGTESSEGGGERIGVIHGDSPEETNGTNGRAPMENSGSGGAAARTTMGETERTGVSASEYVAWEMLGAALRTLDAVGQMGAEVVRKVRDPSQQVCAPLYLSLFGDSRVYCHFRQNVQRVLPRQPLSTE